MSESRMDALLEGDVYFDFPYESAKFRREQATGKVFVDSTASKKRRLRRVRISFIRRLPLER